MKNKKMQEPQLPAVTIGLMCAALDQGLQNILLFDSDFNQLFEAGELLSEMVSLTENRKPRILVTGYYMSEDDLWGTLSIFSDFDNKTNREKYSVSWKKGLLLPKDNNELLIILIPDLSRISLALARACIMLMENPIAYLERQGLKFHWEPQIIWLAGCDRINIGQVSPHLLDRFYLRLQQNNEGYSRSDRVQKVVRLIDSHSKSRRKLLSDEILKTLISAKNYSPVITEEGLERIIEFVSQSKYISYRRDIGVGRLAKAYAKFLNSSEITQEIVDQAIQIISQSLSENPSNDIELENKEETAQLDDKNIKLSSNENNSLDTRIVLSNEETFAPFTVFGENYNEENTLWPEDTAPLEREEGSLRLPTNRFNRRSVVGYGTIFGVEKAKSFQDIAIVSSIFESAKYQHIRHLYFNRKEWIFSPSDLRSYRRNPHTSQLLILLLDFTCLEGCKWEEAIAPYIWWAYTNRAYTCLIQVGAAITKNEYRAERMFERSILTYRFNRLLGSKPGKATPLAHGFELLLLTLQETIKNGASPLKGALVVIVTDGRGNIPIEASHSGEIKGNVSSEGIDNALNFARKLNGIRNVQFVLLDPQPQEYPFLPKEFAEALNAKHNVIALTDLLEE